MVKCLIDRLLNLAPEDQHRGQANTGQSHGGGSGSRNRHQANVPIANVLNIPDVRGRMTRNRSRKHLENIAAGSSRSRFAAAKCVTRVATFGIMRVL